MSRSVSVIQGKDLLVKKPTVLTAHSVYLEREFGAAFTQVKIFKKQEYCNKWNNISNLLSKGRFIYFVLLLLSTDPCYYHRCPEKETCRSEHGNAVCVPQYNSTCWAWGDPHYHTFDGYSFDFQGTCVYQLAALCINNTSLVPFNVTVKNDHRWNNAVSFTHTVNVSVNGFTITLTRERPYQLLVSTVTQYTLIGLRTILVQIQFYLKYIIYIYIYIYIYKKELLYNNRCRLIPKPMSLRWSF